MTVAPMIGTSGGEKTVTAMHVGTAGGEKVVTEGWVGTSGGNKQFFATGGGGVGGPLDASIFSTGWTLVQVIPSILWEGAASAVVTGGSESYTYSWGQTGGNGSITSGNTGESITFQSTNSEPTISLSCIVDDGLTSVTPTADI